MDYANIEFMDTDSTSYFGKLKTIIHILRKGKDNNTIGSFLNNKELIGLQSELHKIDRTIGDIERPFIQEISKYLSAIN